MGHQAQNKLSLRMLRLAVVRLAVHSYLLNCLPMLTYWRRLNLFTWEMAGSVV